MAAKDPATRVLSARIAANARWARSRDRAAETAAGRTGLQAKWAREIDPDGTMARDNPAELNKRVEQMQKAHMLRMSLAARNARLAAREERASSGGVQ